MAPKRKRGTELPQEEGSVNMPIRRNSARIQSNAPNEEKERGYGVRKEAVKGKEISEASDMALKPARKLKKAPKFVGTTGIKADLAEAEMNGATSKVKHEKTPTKSSLSAKKGAAEIRAFIRSQAALKSQSQSQDLSTIASIDDPGGEIVKDNVSQHQLEARRPPPVNSSYLPLPFTGRLGYACLNTYLRTSSPPIFSSRTCRLATILLHRHPLTDPSLPFHPTSNPPDPLLPANPTLGLRYLQQLGLANTRDITKMIMWNEKYSIKFLRLSSEMFPFASHPEHGYDLTFATDVLREAGKVIMDLGHRVSTHPGQFTQLGSPRPQVIEAAVRDLEYHAQMLSLLGLQGQTDRDAVMILHVGGVFGSKTDTLARFRENWKILDESVRRRLVLENDDVCYSVHDILPMCEELGIPMVLDFHHHNILFDETQVREGTEDLMGPLMERILNTWKKRYITPKMHYSEQTAGAVTRRERRRHSDRVRTLPPVPPGVDLMIEAKDKEQAVLELMRTFRLKGWETAAGVVPFEREDDDRTSGKKKEKGKKAGKESEEEQAVIESKVSEEERGMGGPNNRVLWPEGMEDWLMPEKKKRKGKEWQEDEKKMNSGNDEMDQDV